jgi:hypothetical protein
MTPVFCVLFSELESRKQKTEFRKFRIPEAFPFRLEGQRHNCAPNWR